MGQRMTTEEVLEKVFSRSYEELRGRDLRLVRVKVVGREVSLAQLIGVSDRRIYENLGLHIGTHLGEDHTGESIKVTLENPVKATWYRFIVEEKIPEGTLAVTPIQLTEPF